MIQTNDPGQWDSREGKAKRITLQVIAAIIIVWVTLFTWKQWNAWQAPPDIQVDDTLQQVHGKIPDWPFEEIDRTDGRVDLRPKGRDSL